MTTEEALDAAVEKLFCAAHDVHCRNKTNAGDELTDAAIDYLVAKAEYNRARKREMEKI